MRFLHPEYAWWLAAAFAAVALLKWRVRWHFAAFTSILPGRLGPYRASLFRRLPFAVLAIAVALAGLALMQPVIPYSQADLQSKGLDIVLQLDVQPASTAALIDSGQWACTSVRSPSVFASPHAACTCSSFIVCLPPSRMNKGTDAASKEGSP